MHISHRLSFEIIAFDTVGCRIEFLQLRLEAFAALHQGSGLLQFSGLDIPAFELAVFRPLQIEAFFSLDHLAGDISVYAFRKLLFQLRYPLCRIAHIPTAVSRAFVFEYIITYILTNSNRLSCAAEQ